MHVTDIARSSFSHSLKDKVLRRILIPYFEQLIEWNFFISPSFDEFKIYRQIEIYKFFKIEV